MPPRSLGQCGSGPSPTVSRRRPCLADAVAVLEAHMLGRTRTSDDDGRKLGDSCWGATGPTFDRRRQLHRCFRHVLSRHRPHPTRRREEHPLGPGLSDQLVGHRSRGPRSSDLPHPPSSIAWVLRTGRPHHTSTQRVGADQPIGCAFPNGGGLEPVTTAAHRLWGSLGATIEKTIRRAPEVVNARRLQQRQRRQQFLV